jgi:hypothetical protein
LQEKLATFQKQLAAAQMIAGQCMNELLAMEEDQEQAIAEIAAMKGDIAGRKKAWAAITQGAGEGQAAVAGTIKELNVQDYERLEKLTQARTGLDRSNDDLVDQD